MLKCNRKLLLLIAEILLCTCSKFKPIDVFFLQSDMYIFMFILWDTKGEKIEK